LFKARANFVEGSATHKKLENPYCSKFEDNDFDDESSSSESYVSMENTVALETYEYVEHKVSTYTYVLDTHRRSIYLSL